MSFVPEWLAVELSESSGYSLYACETFLFICQRCGVDSSTAAEIVERSAEEGFDLGLVANALVATTNAKRLTW